MGCNCGKKHNLNPPARVTGEYVDPTRALFAAARPTYEVLPHSGATKGKRFSTLSAAQDYARRVRGVIRAI